MAFYARRNNVKPVFRRIAFVMMVVFCLVATGTFHGTKAGQFASPHSMIDGFVGLCLLWVFLYVILYCSIMGFPAFFGFLIALTGGPAFFALVVALLGNLTSLGLRIQFPTGIMAGFALIMKSVFETFILRKFRNGFDFFAFRAAFRYDLLRHNVLSLKRMLCLEPNTRPILVSGSSYFTPHTNQIKQLLKVFKNNLTNADRAMSKGAGSRPSTRPKLGL